MKAEGSRASITLPIQNAPKVRGTAAYLVPTSVTWKAYGFRVRGADRPSIYIAAVASGVKPGTTERARGDYIADLDKPLPEWLERPDEWLHEAETLVRVAMGV